MVSYCISDKNVICIFGNEFDDEIWGMNGPRVNDETFPKFRNLT